MSLQMCANTATRQVQLSFTTLHWQTRLSDGVHPKHFVKKLEPIGRKASLASWITCRSTKRVVGWEKIFRFKLVLGS